MNDRWWMMWAKCAELDPDDADPIFFPKNKRGHKRDITAAKALCVQCPVREYCGMYAIAHRIPYGVWGGMDERDRKRRFDRFARARIRRVWFTKQIEILVRGGEKLGQRDRSIRSVPHRGHPARAASDEGSGHNP